MITNVEGLEAVNPAKAGLVPVRITSNLPLSGTPINYLRLAVTGSPSVGEELSFSYGDVSVSFTVQVLADGSGNTISVQGAFTLSQYISQLAEELQRNYDVFLNFDVDSIDDGGLYYVRIYPKRNTTLEWSFDDGLSNIVASNVQGTNAAYQPNPSIALLVQIWNHSASEYEAPLSHILPILEQSQPVEFDILPDFSLRYHLPPANTIGAGGALITGCTDNWTKFKVSYADRQGETPTVNGLTHDDTEYIAIYAGKTFAQQRTMWWTFWKLNEKFLTEQPRPKTVTMDQPEWLYWIGRNGSQDIFIRVAVTYRDDTTAIFDMGEYAIEEGEVVLIKAGFTQLGLIYDPSNPVVSYTVAVYDSDGDARQSKSYEYELTGECLEWERFYLFGNSLGGCDTVRGTGKVTTSVEHLAQDGERIVTAGVLNDGRGQFFQYNKREQVVLEGSIGYKSAEEIQHLRDMLLSNEVWEVEVESQAFKPLVVEPQTVRVIKDGEDLYSLRWRYRFAWTDGAISPTDTNTNIAAPAAPVDIE